MSTIVKLSNDLKFAAENVDIGYGINVSNCLASNVNSYTATQDCVIVAKYNMNDNTYILYVDGVAMFNMQKDQENFLPLKKGSTVSGYLETIKFTAYGLKK